MIHHASHEKMRKSIANSALIRAGRRELRFSEGGKEFFRTGMVIRHADSREVTHRVSSPRVFHRDSTPSIRIPIKQRIRDLLRGMSHVLPGTDLVSHQEIDPGSV
jgi:hypothetical protein